MSFVSIVSFVDISVFQEISFHPLLINGIFHLKFAHTKNAKTAIITSKIIITI
jgi:hypothetical protein